MYVHILEASLGMSENKVIKIKLDLPDLKRKYKKIKAVVN